MAEPTSLAAAAPLVTKLATAFFDQSKGIASRTREKIEIKLRKGFSRYVKENLNRYSTVKTIISSSTPVALTALYVNLFVASPERAERPHRDEDFLQKIRDYKSVLFTATAGAGKSMLMRYLYLKFLEVQEDRLPVFLELRELNQSPALPFLEYIRIKIADYLAGFSETQLRYAIEQGRLILFLDGFDEIDYDKRKERERQINEVAARYPELWTFVSSRPADTFASWEKFHVFKVQPFTKKQVESLVSKIPYDEEAKAIFRRKLSDGLYNTHKEFLANPLLTIMMLITLEQFAEVPAKIHLFYEYAFEALFGRHDVTKGGIST
jgi:predicted NACHT family NTPase